MRDAAILLANPRECWRSSAEWKSWMATRPEMWDPGEAPSGFPSGNKIFVDRWQDFVQMKDNMSEVNSEFSHSRGSSVAFKTEFKNSAGYVLCLDIRHVWRGCVTIRTLLQNPKDNLRELSPV